MKIVKRAALIIFLLALLGAIIYALWHFHIIKTPALIKTLGEKTTTAQLKINNFQLKSELQKVKQENDILKSNVSAANTKIKNLQAKVNDLQTSQQQDQRNLADYEQQIIALNEKLSSPAGSTNKNNVYKDMAKIFSEMSAKEGADILSRLKDEDIIGILNALNTDVAAELLQKMPRDKAAAVSQKMLVTSP
jgi:flagellar motility protein MotE (MotC chaperone)